MSVRLDVPAMSNLAELNERLDRIEDMAESRPGEALDDLEALTGELEDKLHEHLEGAHRLIRNEDFAGGARALGEAGAVLQRSANLTLALREEIRQRR